MTQNYPNHRFFHKSGSQQYRFENSFRGILYAVRNKFAWIDIDSNWCWSDDRKTRIALAVHWGTIGGDKFHDPQGEFGPDTKWRDLTLSEAKRLVTPEGTHVRTMIEMLDNAKKRGLKGIEWELKGGPWPVDVFLPVLQHAKALKIQVWIKTLVEIKGAFNRLQHAKAAVISVGWGKTVLLNHEQTPVRLAVTQRAYIDYVHGKWQKV